MNLSASRRTWEEASSPAAVRLARKYEQAWRDSELSGRQPDLREFSEPRRHGRRRSGRPAGDPARRHDAAVGRRRKSRCPVVSRPLPRPGRRHHRRSDLRRVLPAGRRPGKPRSAPSFLAVFPRLPPPSGESWRSTSWSGRERPRPRIFFVVHRAARWPADRAFPEAGQTIADF